MSNEWDSVAPCGLFCEECTAFLNEKCEGCRSNEGLSKEFREYCKIYPCLDSKNLKICIDCEEFPCGFFDFFKSEKLEESPWFLDIWNNMKEIKETSLKNFLRKKRNWLEKRRKCAEKKGIKYCDECEQWPCEFLKRPVLVPVDLKGFREFMEKQEK